MVCMSMLAVLCVGNLAVFEGDHLLDLQGRTMAFNVQMYSCKLFELLRSLCQAPAHALAHALVSGEQDCVVWSAMHNASG